MSKLLDGHKAPPDLIPILEEYLGILETIPKPAGVASVGLIIEGGENESSEHEAIITILPKEDALRCLRETPLGEVFDVGKVEALATTPQTLVVLMLVGGYRSTLLQMSGGLVAEA